MTSIPPLILPPAVRAAVGGERADRLAASFAPLNALLEEAPDSSRWPVVIPITAPSKGDLFRRFQDVKRLWPDDVLFSQGQLPDGTAIGRVTGWIGGAGQINRILHLFLFDLHPRMLAWYLTALWRGADLATDLVHSLAGWRVVSAAAVARSLVEGTFAFVEEAGRIADGWSAMKANGPPSPREAEAFQHQLGDHLFQAQFGTRIGQDPARRSGGQRPPRDRLNIQTLLEKGARRAGLDWEPLKDQYEWLCDAVHPSFGSQSAYTREMRGHPAGTELIVSIGRGGAGVPPPGGTDPTVAIALVEAASTAAEQLARALPEFLAVVDDYGLTTEVCFTSRFDYWRRHARPDRNAPCPCGSGRKFKRCIHRWGPSRGPAATSS